jgi:hypothetical protein
MKRDPIENTEKYKKAMEEVQPILDKEFPPDKHYFGMCHAFWCRKAELLKKRGVKWRSPAIMNPHIMFD